MVVPLPLHCPWARLEQALIAAQNVDIFLLQKIPLSHYQLYISTIASPPFCPVLPLHFLGWSKGFWQLYRLRYCLSDLYQLLRILPSWAGYWCGTQLWVLHPRDPWRFSETLHLSLTYNCCSTTTASGFSKLVRTAETVSGFRGPLEQNFLPPFTFQN